MTGPENVGYQEKEKKGISKVRKTAMQYYKIN